MKIMKYSIFIDRIKKILELNEVYDALHELYLSDKSDTYKFDVKIPVELFKKYNLALPGYYIKDGSYILAKNAATVIKLINNLLSEIYSYNITVDNKNLFSIEHLKELAGDFDSSNFELNSMLAWDDLTEHLIEYMIKNTETNDENS